MLKPSEQTPVTSQLLAELLPQYLDPELYHFVNGGVPETTRVRVYLEVVAKGTKRSHYAASGAPVGPQ